MILVTRDGESIDVDFSITLSNINSNIEVGLSGWYQYKYEYAISALNFDEDGIYKITLVLAYSTNDLDKNDSNSVSDNPIKEYDEQFMIL